MKKLAIALASALTLVAAGCSAAATGDGLDPDKLTVYSAQHENVTKAWAEGFTEKTGIEVQIRNGKDISMGNQIVEEGDASPADVFLTENSPAMTTVQEADMLAPVDDTTKAQIPEGRAPSNGLWIGIAARSTVLVYNPSMITEAELPTSMMDLADPKWKDQWGAGASGADFQAIVAGMLSLKGEEATKAWLAGLKDNAKIYQNNIATMKAVNAGEVPMGIMYHYYWYRDQAGTKEGSANTQLYYFKNQDPGAFVSLSAGGVLKSSKKSKEAQEFLAYVTSPEGQAVLTEAKTMEYAVANNSTSDPALPPLESLDPPVIDPFSLDAAKVAELMTDAGVL
ncbi:extracellular solute-binding protein [Epidermidibacterium keratini]|uniref:Extracellular solute-binding protein n=1 Tax=Epidermidibacterium keratini TaxID=1891644 RepID=A0A7L4YPJ0_9ACTN|nr:iron ABC transporter substrate-binding protein [Epidermidibacterium keratini]QHC00813.1 extracellular solute-binding protein [Epidermidibacterium keratini]